MCCISHRIPEDNTTDGYFYYCLSVLLDSPAAGDMVLCFNALPMKGLVTNFVEKFHPLLVNGFMLACNFLFSAAACHTYMSPGQYLVIQRMISCLGVSVVDVFFPSILLSVGRLGGFRTSTYMHTHTHTHTHTLTYASHAPQLMSCNYFVGPQSPFVFCLTTP